MNLPLYIAKRYLFSKKSHNAINIISAISVCGVALATLALVCTLSVFNGFHDLISSFFTHFDPDLKVEVIKGKTFTPDSTSLARIQALSDVEVVSTTLEDHAMARYQEQQAMVTIKGVDDNFQALTHIEEVLYGNPEFKLYDAVADYGIMGIQLMYLLGTGIQPYSPIEVYAPRKGGRVNMSNPMSNFQRKPLYSPGTVFNINDSRYASSYIITSLDYARSLFEYTSEISAIEIRLAPNANITRAKRAIQEIMGSDFTVHDHYEQQAATFKVVKIEKFVTYLFLCFILMVACFNIISSVSMLILDKQDNANTLRSLGTTDTFISRIFIYEGNLIALIGALVGLVLGIVLCLLQQHFGIIGLGGDGQFVVDAYPVRVKLLDILLVFASVIVVSALSVWLPIRLLNAFLQKKTE
ncbi:MAG: FtsX-like permease family protein [Bacteroidaceae bacterium]|nr:FtsX-like permease family protein [Bacteroidaceae bacterium]